MNQTFGSSLTHAVGERDHLMTEIESLVRLYQLPSQRATDIKETLVRFDVVSYSALGDARRSTETGSSASWNEFLEQLERACHPTPIGKTLRDRILALQPKPPSSTSSTTASRSSFASSDLEIRILSENANTIQSLALLLVETVAAGGSVSFMHPLSKTEAESFWSKSLAAASRGERIVLGAFAKNSHNQQKENEPILGTVSVLLDCPPNQPHRAEIAKMMVSVAHRNKGIASALLDRAEQEARNAGKTLLILDTASDGGASRLYERHGFQFAGEIPDFALKPHGGLTGTRIYWKRIGEGTCA